MEFRLGNQQRHSITAVLLSAVVVIFGLVLVDRVSGPPDDPLRARTEAVESTSSSDGVSASEAADDLTSGVARSNARFMLNPDVTGLEAESSTTTAGVRRTTEVVVGTSPPASRGSSTTTTTTSPTTSATSTTVVTDPPPSSSSSSSSSSTSSSTTATTEVEPPETPSTTVDDDETTTTKKCRGNRPGCRDPKP